MKFMTPQRFRMVRENAGLSLDALARALRISEKASVHRWEKGQRAISGPVSVLMELLEAGELPSRYLYHSGDQDPEHTKSGS